MQLGRARQTRAPGWRRTAPVRDLRLAPELSARFARYRWPGNLRQLANALRTAVALLDEGETLLTAEHLPGDLGEDLGDDLGDDLSEALEAAAPPAASNLPAGMASDPEDLRQLADARIRATLAAVNGNVSEAARRLGISRNTLYRRVR